MTADLATKGRKAMGLGSGGKPVAMVAGAVALVALIAVGFTSFYTVDEGERAVQLTNGRVTGVGDPGLHFKVPFFQSYRKISVQSLTRSYNGLPAYSSDQQPAQMRVSVSFRITDLVALYSTYGSIEGMLGRLLDRQVPTQTENIFGRFTAVRAVRERTNLVADLSQALRAAVSGPVQIESVQVENIDFSDAYERSVEERMKAEVEVQTQKQTLEKEKINAEIAVTQARGRAESRIAQAQAEAEAIRLRGEAEAEAIKARAAALAQNQNLVELVKAEKWNGQLPTTMLPNGTVPFLTSTR